MALEQGLGLKLSDLGESLVLTALIETAGTELETFDRGGVLPAMVTAVNFLRASDPNTEAQLILASDVRFEEEAALRAVDLARSYMRNILGVLTRSGESFNIDRIDLIPNGKMDMVVVLSRTKNK